MSNTYDDASLILYPSGYKAGKLYSLKPTDGSGDLDVVRATTATRVDSDGLIEEVAINVPRIDYTGGGCGKLLLEPQRSNTAQFSEQFNNAFWTATDVTITANNAISPDGFQNADKVTENTANNAHRVTMANQSGSGTVTYSVFAKYDSRTIVYLQNPWSNNQAWFNIQTGSILSSANCTPTIQNMGNGWFRCIIVATGVTEGLNGFYIGLSNADGVFSYTGNGTASAYIYGAQIELGAYATSYIPTLGAVSTRAADVASKTGISDLIGQTEGTIFLEVAVNNANTGNGVFFECIGATTADTMVFFIDASNNNLAFFNSDGLGVAEIIQTPYTPSTTLKIALAYKNSDFAVYVNGVSKTISALNMVPTALANIYLNTNRTGGEVAQSTYNQTLLFPTRLSNTELETLTTL